MASRAFPDWDKFLIVDLHIVDPSCIAFDCFVHKTITGVASITVSPICIVFYTPNLMDFDLIMHLARGCERV